MHKIKENYIVLGILFLSLWMIVGFQNNGVKQYNRYVNDTLSYNKAIVTKIIAEDKQYDEILDLYLGTQQVAVIIEGKEEEVIITNYLSKTHNVHLQENSHIIVNVDQPENIEPYYTVYNYDRGLAIVVALIILVVAIVVVGKGKGVKSILGLVYTLFLIFFFLLPSVFSGYSPITMSMICAVLSTMVTLLLLNGQKMKTYAAIIATIIGVILSLLFFLLFSYLLNIDGFNAEEVEGLLLISQSTGLQIKDLLFASVLIASLGAIMDVGLSIVSALYEVSYHNPTLSSKQLFLSGLEIGKDMIGTMSNTLILAFTGSTFISLMIFISYQVQWNQIMNSNFVAIEIAQGICGTLGIVLTVPIASLVGARFLTIHQFTNKSKASR